MTRQHPVPASRRAYRTARTLDAYAQWPELQAVDALPFVRLVRLGSWSGPGRRCHWHVEHSGDYGADCDRGCDLAGATFEHLRRFPGSSLVSMTLTDMVHVAGGELDGVMVGYLEWIAAMVNADRGRFRFDDYWRQRVRVAA